MATLTIQFRGLCAHFWNNIFHGIGHRAVLPDAGPLRAGLLTGAFIQDPEDPANWLPYLIQPHFAFITMGDFPFTTPGLIEDGYLFTNSHLRVVNATPTGLNYEETFMTSVPQLTEYFPAYSPSDDVIIGGGAAAYFDIFSGNFSAFPNGKSMGVQVIIETDGAPQLRVTPMVTGDQPVITQEFTLNDTSEPLIISNTSPICVDDDCDFDFLGHYLTAVGGIPRTLAALPPGLNLANVKPPSVSEILKKLEKLEDAGYPGFIKRWPRFSETSASCSDSRYP